MLTIENATAYVFDHFAKCDDKATIIFAYDATDADVEMIDVIFTFDGKYEYYISVWEEGGSLCAEW